MFESFKKYDYNTSSDVLTLTHFDLDPLNVVIKESWPTERDILLLKHKLPGRQTTVSKLLHIDYIFGFSVLQLSVTH